MEVPNLSWSHSSAWRMAPTVTCRWDCSGWRGLLCSSKGAEKEGKLRKRDGIKGSSLVEALPPLRHVTLSMELSIGTFGYSSTKQDESGQL